MLTDWPLGAVIVLGVLLPLPGAGANLQAQTREPQGKATSSVERQVPDPSLARIRRLLRETPATRLSSSLLHLNYHVEVVAAPPRIDFFKDFNLGRDTPVQYGGMTHDEFMRLTAPPWRRSRW